MITGRLALEESSIGLARPKLLQYKLNFNQCNFTKAGS